MKINRSRKIKNKNVFKIYFQLDIKAIRRFFYESFVGVSRFEEDFFQNLQSALDERGRWMCFVQI